VTSRLHLLSGLSVLFAVSCVEVPPEAPPSDPEADSVVTFRAGTWDELDCPDSARGPDGLCSTDTTVWPELYPQFWEQPETIASLDPVPDCEALFDEIIAIDESVDTWSPQDVWSDLLQPEDLGSEIWAEVHMDFLLEGLSDRPLEVLLLHSAPRIAPGGNEFTEYLLILRDRFAGDVVSSLFVPAGDSLPAVVVMPGHAETGEFHLEERYGAYFAGAGFAVIAPWFRASTQDPGPLGRGTETETALTFVCQDMNLMAMRAYEALLAQRAIAAWPGVDLERIGLLGHSGGSSAAHLLFWEESSPFPLYVIDNAPAHSDVDLMANGDYTLDCGVHPRLAELETLIADVCALPAIWDREVVRIPYAYSSQSIQVDDECSFWPWSPIEVDPLPDDTESVAIVLAPFLEGL
jgi:hypothetical protein